MVRPLTAANAEFRYASRFPSIGIEAASTRTNILRLAGYCAVVACGNKCDFITREGQHNADTKPTIQKANRRIKEPKINFGNSLLRV